MVLMSLFDSRFTSFSSFIAFKTAMIYWLNACSVSEVQMYDSLFNLFWDSLFFQVLATIFFLSGFLSQLAKGNSIAECVRCGHYAANYMIQQSGVTLNHSPNFS